MLSACHGPETCRGYGAGICPTSPLSVGVPRTEIADAPEPAARKVRQARGRACNVEVTGPPHPDLQLRLPLA